MFIKPIPKFENIFAIAIPLPEIPDLITANVYVLGNGPVTLIDTGPKMPGALELFREGLTGAGLDFQDIERMIFTHGHLDHFGLAAEIRKAAGFKISCFIHEQDLWCLSAEYIREEMFGKEAEAFMASAGLPQEERDSIRRRFSSFADLFDPLEGVCSMKDGDTFMGEGYRLRVIHTPGHTPGSCCIYESEQKILFSGDHIIGHITPNPLVVLNRKRLKDPAYQSLETYLDSLERLENLNVQFVFPGHGDYVEDLSGIVASYRVHHRERMDLVWNALREKAGPLFKLVPIVFPKMPEDDLFLALSEILVHLEMLIQEGRAALIDPGPPALYMAL